MPLLLVTTIDGRASQWASPRFGFGVCYVIMEMGTTMHDEAATSSLYGG
jgi:hypothetical protein